MPNMATQMRNMTVPQVSMQDTLHNKMRNIKLRQKLDFDSEVGGLHPVVPHTVSDSRVNVSDSPLGPALDTAKKATLPVHAVYDKFFAEYETAKLDIQQQHDFIGQLRNEVPLIDRDEIDSLHLGELAKILEVSIFPACKMLHVNPKAVKRMMDEQFRKAYGLEVEQEIARDTTPAVADEGDDDIEADAGVENSSATTPAIRKTTRGKAKDTKATEAAASAKEPPKKKARCPSAKTGQEQNKAEHDAAAVPVKKAAKKKVEPTSSGDPRAQVEAYRAKRKKAKKGCRVVTLRSRAAAEK